MLQRSNAPILQYSITPSLHYSIFPCPLPLAALEAPLVLAMLAFSPRTGGPITVVDEQGRKQELTGARSASLPAWSDDGSKMAWLERKDRKHFDLTIAAVSVN